MRKNRRKDKFRKGEKPKPDRDAKPKHYEFIKPENAEFEAYYKLQNICPNEEWDALMKCLATHLPTSFRITRSKSEAKALLNIIKGQYFKEYINTKREEGSEEIEPVALPWYPDNLAWQIQLTRNDIRRSEALFKLHNFLISESDSGNITRQEVVSMIPPIALGVKPHHKVLDMCAAPGSKTAQLIEDLHANDKIPEGFIIGNDVANNRCYMLVHQAKRLSSPNIIITNHDATAMPNFMVKLKNGKEEILKFDRILCDVPCSGDGTLRKNPSIWTKWNPSHGIHFHGIQYRVARRGCEMLAVGGRLVYSTCSLNPIENEAVVMRLLTEAKGALKLIDLTSTFPNLKFKKGLTTWTPMSKDMVSYKTFEEVPERWHSVLRPQMFPPSQEAAAEHNIERCMRIVPHHQNTGGFFIAALEKVSLLPWESTRGVKTDDAEQVSESIEVQPVTEPPKKRKRMFGYKEDPFVFFTDDEPLWHQIRDFYEINDELKGNCLLTRCKEGKKKNIYLTSPQVREIIMTNCDRIKIINSGVKAFARCDNKDMTCPFRLAEEGLSSIFPYIGPKRKVQVTRDDLLLLLNVQDYRKPPEIEKLNPVTQEKIKKLGRGSCVLVYDEEPVTDASLHLELVGWIGYISARAYIPTSDCAHYIRLLGGDTSRFDVNKFKKIENGDREDGVGEEEKMDFGEEAEAAGGGREGGDEIIEDG